MSHRQFITQLAILTAGAAVLVYFLNRLPHFVAFRLFSWLCLLAFVGLSIAMYYLGALSAKSNNKNDFTNTVLGFTAGKMFLAIAVILGYYYLGEPDSKLFIVPFFSIYLIYTIFETYFMMKLGRINP